MTYKKYKITNNAETSIDGDISASASTLIVKENEGDLFPSEFPFLATLEHFDTQGYVTKREIIEVSNRSGDNFTITRAVEPCVQDDIAGTKTQTQNALSFESGDKISIYPTKGITEDIQNEVSRLETDKANDDEVLHNSGDETATGKKTFEEIKVNGDITVDGVINGDGSGLINVNALETPGIIKMYAGNTAPNGYLMCDGSEISRDTYSRLYDVIGTTYGDGDGSTTFNLPNLKGKVVVGLDGNQTEFDTLGKTGGEKTHTLTIDEMPEHNHSVPNMSSGSNSTNTGYANNAGDSSPGTIITGNTGGGQAHNNLQPYVTLNYIIAY